MSDWVIQPPTDHDCTSRKLGDCKTLLRSHPSLQQREELLPKKPCLKPGVLHRALCPQHPMNTGYPSARSHRLLHRNIVAAASSPRLAGHLTGFSNLHLMVPFPEMRRIPQRKLIHQGQMWKGAEILS